MAYKPILTTGVAIASAAAIVAATPALLSNPGPGVRVAAPTPTVMAPLRQLSVADIQLLNAFSLAGLGNAVFNGYGGIVTGTPLDPTGLLCTGTDAKCNSLVVGAAYYLTDTLLLPTTTLDNHLFEQGLITGLVEFAREFVPEDDAVANAVLDSILQPLRAPIFFSEALLGEFSPVTQFLTALWDGGIVGVIRFLINGPEPAPPPEEDATLLSKTNAGGVQTLDASLALEAGTSAVGKFKAPDLSKLVSLPVEPLEKKVEDAEGGDTLTVDTTAGDTTEVQDPTNEGGTVEEVKTEAPEVEVEVQDPASGAGTVEEVKTEEPQVEAQDPATEDNTVEPVKTEKPKFNEKKVNPLADLKGDPVLPVTSNDGSSEKPESGLTKAIKKFVGGLGKHKSEGTGTGAAAADGGGSESGGGDAG